MEEKFNIGDVVVLKSGSNAMTIAGQEKKHMDMTSPATFTGRYHCVWHANGIEQNSTLHQDALELE